jgi:lipoic acid synthetase
MNQKVVVSPPVAAQEKTEHPTAVPLPPWFKQKIPRAGQVAGVQNLLRGLGLHTVCDGARCPNRGLCFSQGTATFLIMGDTCTRNCTFCNVHQGSPAPLDTAEPEHLTEAVRRLGLNYVVVTSVTRDDLPDGGAEHFARTLGALHRVLPLVRVEVLVPDFKGSEEAVRTVMVARPQVFAHNLETVPRLYLEVRPKADYKRSLDVLRLAKHCQLAAVTKSALMLGLGETRDEVLAALRDLRAAGCDLLTLGQYLAMPGRHPVVRYLPPAEFAEYERLALAAGFVAVASAPLVRSSFRAGELYDRAQSINPGHV